MKNLTDCKDNIHSCSKCGLCQSVCPIYKITGNDCTVSRGHFIMLRGLINGELKMSKTINKYLDLCLKCGACSKFCPSGIDVVDIVALAKAEYFKSALPEKFISFFQKYLIFNFLMNTLSMIKPHYKSLKFEKKVIYFGGCGVKINNKLDKSVKKLLNSCNIEVITPSFNCCGIPYYVRGDMENYQQCAANFIHIIKQIGIKDIVTTCASCEKTLKSYAKLIGENDFTVKNIFEYIKENKLNLTLKKEAKVTFHKPCNINNWEDIESILNNTKNLEYTEMKDYDKCCGLNGITKFDEYKTMMKLYRNKRRNIINSGAKTVLTSCLGCEAALKAISFGKYKVEDITEFLAKNINV